MAVSFDTVQSTSNNSTTASIPITPSTDANRMLLAVMWCDTLVESTDVSPNCFIGSTATASDEFTLLSNQSNAGEGMIVWYMVSPTTDALTVTFAYDPAGDTAAGTMAVHASVSNWFGVDPAAPTDTVIFTTGNSTADTHDANITTDGMLVDLFGFGSTTATISSTTGQTEIINTAGLVQTVGQSYETPATSPDDQGWTGSVAATWSHLTLGLLPLGATTVSLTGTMASTDIVGTITRKNSLAFTGAIGSAQLVGTIVRKNSIALTGAMSSIVGTMTQKISLILSGGITPTGSFDATIKRLLGKIVFGLTSAFGIKFGQSGSSSDNAARFDTDNFGDPFGPP